MHWVFKEDLPIRLILAYLFEYFFLEKPLFGASFCTLRTFFNTYLPIVVGVSSDSTVFIWDRATGALREVMYHHRASVWGIRIQDNWIITGSMDGTISVVDIETLQLKKHFLAHENEWGSKYKTSIKNRTITYNFKIMFLSYMFVKC